MKHTPIIDGLVRAIELEKTVVAYYKEAHTKGRTGEIARIMQRLEDSHFIILGRLKSRKEELEHQQGEGLLGNMLQSIGQAIVDTVAGLPVGAIHAETDPTISMLVRSEQELRAHYEHLLPLADPDTLSLIEAGIRNVDASLQHLQELA